MLCALFVSALGTHVVLAQSTAEIDHQDAAERPAEQPVPLAPLPEEAPVLELLNQLAAPDAEMVGAAIARAGRSRLVIFDQPLQAILASTAEPELRAAAAAMLADLEWPTLQAALVTRIESLARAARDQEPSVRLAAINALGAYPTLEARQVLAGCLVAADSDERLAVQEALERLHQPAVLARLSAWLAHGVEPEQSASASPEWRLAPAAQLILADPKREEAARGVVLLRQVTNQPSVRWLVHHAIRYGSTPVRLAALTTLQQQPRPEDLSLIFKYLAHTDPATRGFAARAAGAHHSETVTRALADRMAVEQHTRVLADVAAGLGGQETGALCAALLSVIRGQPGEAQTIAVRLVRERRDPEAFWAQVFAYAALPEEPARKALVGTDAAVRQQVLLPALRPGLFVMFGESERGAILTGLSQISTPAVAEAIVALLTPETSAALIAEVAPLLAQQDDGVVVPHLRALLAAPDLVAREEIYRLLLARPSVDGAELLTAGLERETDPGIRRTLLGHAAGRDEPTLIAAVAHELDETADESLIAAALTALAEVRDPTLGQRYTALVRTHAGSEIGKRAYELLLALPDPAPLNGVRTLARDGNLALTTRLAAIEAVGLRGTRLDLQMLEELLATEDGEARLAVRDAMHAIAPEDYPLFDTWGRYPLVAAASGLGASLFGLVAATAGVMSGDTDDKRTTGLAIGGAILGGATAWLFTINEDVSLGQAGYFATVGLWGTLGGFSLARATHLSDTDPSAALWSTIAGQAAGIALGGATLSRSKFTLEDVMLTNLVAASWGFGGIGAQRLADRGSPTGPAPEDAFFLGGLLGTAPMLVLSPYVDLDANDLLGIGGCMAVGSWLGAFAPFVFLDDGARPDSLDALAGIAMGQAIGLTGGLALSAVTDFDGWTFAWGGIGLVTGAGTGGGLALLAAPGDRRAAFGLVEGGTLLGGGLLAWLGPKLEYGDNDAALITLMATAGAVAGSQLPAAAIGAVSDIRSNTREQTVLGGLLLGSTLGFYAGLGSSQLLDLSAGELTMAGVGAAMLGLGSGGMVLMIPGADEAALSPVMSTATAAGVLGLAFLTPHLRYTRDDAVFGASTAALGLGLGLTTPILWAEPSTDLPAAQLAGGALAGATLGAFTAGAISQFTEITWRQTLRADAGSLAGVAIGAGLGLVSPDIDRRATVALAQTGAIAGYSAALIFKGDGNLDLAEGLHLGLGTAIGAWHGWQLPFLWRERSATGRDVPEEEIAGGLMLGAGLGVLGAGLLDLALAHDENEVGEVVLYELLGASLGGGLALVLEDEDRRLRFGLMQGAGLLAFGLGEWLAPYTEYTKQDRWLVAAMIGEGVIGGLGLPFLFGEKDPTEGQIGGGALMAGAAGGLLGLAASQVRPSELPDIYEMAAMSGLGAIAGLGISASIPGTDRHHLFMAADIGWLAGMGLGLGLAPYTELTEEDLIFMTAASAVTGWAAGLMPRVIHPGRAGAEQIAAAGTAGVALGFVGAGALAQAFEVDRAVSLEATVLAAAGGLAASGFDVMGVPGSPEEATAWQIATALGGFGLGLGLGQITELSYEDVLLMTSTAGLGAWHGAFAPSALGHPDGAATAGSMMVGAGIGTFLGYGLTQFIDLDRWDNLELVSTTAVGSMIGTGAGLLAGLDWRGNAAALEIGSLAGLGLGAGLAHLTEYGGRANLLLAGGAWGAWNGGWLGAAIAAPDPEKRIAGGALVGLGGGLALSMAAAQLLAPTDDEIIESTLFMAAGNLIGGGAGLLFEADPSATLGLVAGLGTAGLVAGWGLSPYTEYNARGYGLAAMMGSLGAVHGGLLAGILDHRERGAGQDAVAALGGAMLGAGVGTVGGMLLAQRLEVEPLDMVEIAMTTGLGAAMGGGLATWSKLGGPGVFALIEGCSLGLTTLGFLVAEATDFDGPDRLLVLHGGLLGGWLGAWAPVLWNASDGRLDAPGFRGEDLPAGMLVGMGAGMLTGGLASQFFDLEYDDVGEVMLGSALSSTLGAGLGLVLSPDHRVWVGLMQGTGLLGTLAVAAASPYTEYDSGDAVLGLLTGLYGVYQGVGLELLANANAGPNELAGAMMLGSAAGGLAGMYLGRYVDLDATDVSMLAAGSAWGMWLGVCLTVVLNDPDRVGIDETFKQGTGYTALFTDLGLAAMSLGVSKLVDLEPLRFAWISVGGGIGTLLGFLTGTVVPDIPPAERMWHGLLWGTVGGLVAGTILTQFVDLPGMGELPEAPLDGELPAPAVSARWLPEIEQWYPSVQVTPAGAEPGGPTSEGTQYLFTLSGTFR